MAEISKMGNGRAFNMFGEVNGDIKGYTLNGYFYGSVAGKQYEEVVGAITGNLKQGTTQIEAQGVFAGSKQ
ncbi:hypothetical protein [Gallibacterium anatis]